LFFFQLHGLFAVFHVLKDDSSSQNDLATGNGALFAEVNIAALPQEIPRTAVPGR
jgi:hypothetical protein